MTKETAEIRKALSKVCAITKWKVRKEIYSDFYNIFFNNIWISYYGLIKEESLQETIKSITKELLRFNYIKVKCQLKRK